MGEKEVWPIDLERWPDQILDNRHAFLCCEGAGGINGRESSTHWPEIDHDVFVRTTPKNIHGWKV